jgi:hypothetical protein
MHLRKYNLGTGVAALLTIAAVSYNNSRCETNIVNNRTDQTQSSSIKSIDNSVTPQSNPDVLEQYSVFAERVEKDVAIGELIDYLKDIS